MHFWMRNQKTHDQVSPRYQNVSNKGAFQDENIHQKLTIKFEIFVEISCQISNMDITILNHNFLYIFNVIICWKCRSMSSILVFLDISIPWKNRDTLLKCSDSSNNCQQITVMFTVVLENSCSNLSKKIHLQRILTAISR